MTTPLKFAPVIIKVRTVPSPVGSRWLLKGLQEDATVERRRAAAESQHDRHPRLTAG